MPYSDDQYLLVARDVTQIKQLDNLRKDFVANVSHELKTPLTVLQGYLEMVEDPELHSAEHYDVMLWLARGDTLLTKCLDLGYPLHEGTKLRM